MPAPMVVVAVAKQFGDKFKKSDSDSKVVLIGGIVALLGLTFIVPIVLISSLVTSIGAGSNADPCTIENTGFETGSGDPGGEASPEALKDIPKVALSAYRKSAAATGVDWTYLAAIGKVETNHGRYNGSAPDEKGDVRPIIRNSIGASGPMQFMPPTWGQYQQDGNFDGVKSVDNIFDAALASGRYLVRSGAPNDMRSAIFAYNRANWYVNKIIKQAKAYAADGGTGGPANVQVSQFAQADSKKKSSWIRPVKGGPITARFGQGGGRWSSGQHTGTDFGVPTGTPVFAAQSGRVSVSHPGWAGNLVTIDHGKLNGKNIKSQYGHLSRVKVSSGMVEAGDIVAYSGALGNVTGPHLHFEVLVNGAYANPESYLSGAGTPVFVGTGDPGESEGCSDALAVGDEDQNTEWSGYKNGRIPATAMCDVKFKPGAKLRCDAAKSMDSLNAAYKKKFKTNMPLSVTYRDYSSQVSCRAVNPDCEAPGSSRFGYALVVKFTGAIAKKSTAEYAWMKDSGIGEGWVETKGAWEFGKKTPAKT